MEDEFSSINVIPLVDIMLVLITIVLITSNFMVRGLIPVTLPKSEAPQEMVKEAVSITITREGIIYLKETPVTIPTLISDLNAYDAGTPVIISADKDLTLSPFVAVLDIIRKRGFTKVSLETEK